MNSAFSIWLHAIRPKTLPLATGAIFLGSSVAYHGAFFDAVIFSLALITALLLQIISNLANDYGDAKSGADNEHRVGPTRVMQAGLVNKQQMKFALFFTITLAVVTGCSLLYIALAQHLIWLLSFIGLGAIAIIAAITYTMPVSKSASPYGYHGYGDIAVFVFFGLVAVIGSYALFALNAQSDMSWYVIYPAMSAGFLSAAVLNINNIRDLDTDLSAGKITLAVKLGEKKAISYHWCLLALAEISAAVYIVYAQVPVLTWLHVLAFPLLIKSAISLKNRKDASLMNQQLKTTALMSFMFCTLLALGHVL